MTVLTICGMAVILCISCIVIRQIQPDMSKAVIVTASVIIAGFAVTEVLPTIEYLKSIDGGENYPEYLKIMLKGAGIGIICETVSDICTDCGESALAGKVLLAGKIQILAVSLPMIKKLIELGTGILQ